MANYSKLLINEPPLQVLPTLAKKLDINKAVILQQIQYWLNTAGHEKDGRLWVYNSYEEWSKQFPWLTARSVRHHISELEKDGLLLTANYNKDNRDKTKWYSIDYDKLDSITNLSCHETDYDSPCDEEGTMHVARNDRPLPETTTETTSIDNVRVIWGELKNVKLSPREHRDLVARFGLDKTKKLIDNLSFYIKSKGDKYKSHYATILNWVRMDEGKKEKNGTSRGSFEANQKYTEYEDAELKSGS